ncbi:MAG: 50S ribosomal protein L9 [Deltaproteobacteria bacterium]|nr:50S ribosomal protein L9 [Deltaproteobacteria bacterium]MBW2419095.1 50S ribosomal protein L9 [Deltaproteobacteria bacterium]
MGNVKVILREDVQRLGHAGDVVSVKPGYARNFLIPGGKASVATESKVNELEHHRRVISEQLAKQLKDVEAIRHKLQSVSLGFEMQAGEEGKLFGSVTSQHIAEQLAQKGFAVDRRKVVLSEPIKEIGEHTVEVKLHREIAANIKVVVTALE